jgi:hypothetical protein
MLHPRRRRWVVLATAIATGMVVAAPPASAAPPANDRLRHAIVIPSIPYTNEQSTVGAGSDGPRFCSNNGSVFYSFTPTETRRLQADTVGSDYDTVLGVFTGGFSDAVGIACNDDRYGLQSAVRFRAEAGTTYHFIIGFCCGNGADHDENGNLVFTLDRAMKDAPLQGDVTVDPEGTVSIDGSAGVSGSATCNVRSQVGIFGALRQAQGDVTVRGSVSLRLVCDPSAPTPWSVTVEPRDGGTFMPGSARLRYSESLDSYNSSTFTRGLLAHVTLTEA